MRGSYSVNGGDPFKKLEFRRLCGCSSIDIDLAELGTIKTYRAIHDPFIVHESTRDWAPLTGDQIYRDIRLARLQQNRETPLRERIAYATWPETVLYFSTLTMDERFVTQAVKELYQHSFREYLDEQTYHDSDRLPAPLDQDPELTDYQCDRLNDLRFGIKKDRDRFFVDEYEEYGTVAFASESQKDFTEWREDLCPMKPPEFGLHCLQMPTRR